MENSSNKNESIIKDEKISTEEPLTVTDLPPELPPLDLNVYIIFSRWSINQLDLALSNLDIDVGFLRIVYDRENRETNQSLCIISKESYEKLVDLGYGSDRNEKTSSFGKGFKIAKFILKYNVPAKEHLTNSIFIPVPRALASDETFVLSTIQDKLIHLSEWGILNSAEDFSINLPLTSREYGHVKHGAYVVFKQTIDIRIICTVRHLLNFTFWGSRSPDEPRYLFKVFWTRVYKKPEGTNTEIENKFNKGNKNYNNKNYNNNNNNYNTNYNNNYNKNNNTNNNNTNKNEIQEVQKKEVIKKIIKSANVQQQQQRPKAMQNKK